MKGSDPIDTRPGFAAMLEALEANGTKTIVVETANRFARDLMVQEVGLRDAEGARDRPYRSRQPDLVPR